MSRSKLLTVIACLAIASTPSHARKHSAITKPAWLSLTQAYSSGNKAVVNSYTHSDKRYLRLYAAALRDLSNRDPKAAARDGSACDDAKPRTAAAATAYFYCLSAVTTEFFQDALTKDGYIWESKLVSFYKKYADDIDKETGLDNPSEIKDVDIPSLNTIRTWPDQVAFREEGWKNISLENGVATAYIDHRPILVRPDTGSTSIFLARSDIAKFKLQGALIPLGKTTSFAENSSSFFNAKLYYVRSFTFGPVRIQNAYVVVYDGQVSLIGMSVLQQLRKFSISSHGIGHFYMSNADVCNLMLYSRSGRSGSFPFSYIKTDFGRMGFMLDSGLIGQGPFVDTEIALAPDQVRLVERRLNDSNATVVTGSVAENNKRVRFNTVIFHIKINGRNALAYFAHGNYYDKRLAGRLTFNFLKHTIVSYDFPGRMMCLRRLGDGSGKTVPRGAIAK